MDCGLYGFLLLRFLEKESAQRAAARNPKGDKSGRGLPGRPAWALLEHPFGSFGSSGGLTFGFRRFKGEPGPPRQSAPRWRPRKSSREAPRPFLFHFNTNLTRDLEGFRREAPSPCLRISILNRIRSPTGSSRDAPPPFYYVK